MHITPPGKKKGFSPSRSPAIALLLVIGILFVGKAALASYDRFNAQNDRTDQISKQLSVSQSHEDALRKENEWMQTSRAEEAVVRERYMVAKPSEKVIVVQPNDDDQGKVITAPAQVEGQ